MKTEAVIEAAAIGLFMVSAAVVTIAVEHPASPVRATVSDPVLRRAITGICMGLTAMALIYSPPGRRSGLHMNPSVTFTFWRLGKVRTPLAGTYVCAQFAGAVVGLGFVAVFAGRWLADPAVSYAATRPGAAGVLVAFGGELLISFGIMLTVLFASNTPRLMPYTGLLVGCLVATYITVESPLSGMSMNPARTLAPMLVGHVPTTLWIYFTAPPLGMLAASELYVRVRGRSAVACAKLQHPGEGPCVFGCQRASAH